MGLFDGKPLREDEIPQPRPMLDSEDDDSDDWDDDPDEYDDDFDEDED